jgi:hypothetical protein
MRKMRGATRGVWRPVAQVAGLAVLVVAGALAAAAYRAHAGGPGGVSLPNGADSYLPAHRRVAGPQIEMVYVGGSDCAGSNQPGFPKAVDRLKKRLAMAARARGMSFRAVGLAVEWSVQKGEAHLNKLGYCGLGALLGSTLTATPAVADGCSYTMCFDDGSCRPQLDAWECDGVVGSCQTVQCSTGGGGCDPQHPHCWEGPAVAP